jgi:Uma2 family endonuclease
VLHRITVAEYRRMIDAGVFSEDDPIELLDGYLVQKMPRNPAHDGTIDLALGALAPLIPAEWFLRIQQAITLDDSQPEPDLCAVRGTRRTFLTRHPGPADVGLVIEVAESSLLVDREEKSRIYAAANIPDYWIVNLVDRQVEVLTGPSGPTSAPDYSNRRIYGPGDAIPFALVGTTIGQVAVRDLLP